MNEQEKQDLIDTLRAMKAAMDEIPASLYHWDQIDNRYLESNINAAYSALIDAFGVLGIDVLAESKNTKEGN